MTNAEKLLSFGYDMDDIVTFVNPSFEGALIGVTTDDRAIYDFDLMAESFMKEKRCTKEEAVEWIEDNTIQALPFIENAPIIMYPF